MKWLFLACLVVELSLIGYYFTRWGQTKGDKFVQAVGSLLSIGVFTIVIIGSARSMDPNDNLTKTSIPWLILGVVSCLILLEYTAPIMKPTADVFCDLINRFLGRR